jgi:hypothetical protein
MTSSATRIIYKNKIKCDNMSGLTGYFTIGGVDLSNVFLNINGVTQRLRGTNGPTVSSNVLVTANVPLLFAAYADYPSRSGVAYAYVFYNPSLAAGSGMSTPTYIPPLASGGSPFTSIVYNSAGYITVSTSTSQSYNWFFINLTASNSGFVTNNLDLTQRFRNINGFATPASGSYINSVTTNTFSIPNPNVPYQFIAYSTGATRSGMIAAYVYYSSTVAVGGVTVISNIGNMGFGLTYSSGTIRLTTSFTTTNNIIYNFNTVV